MKERPRIINESLVQSWSVECDKIEFLMPEFEIIEKELKALTATEFEAAFHYTVKHFGLIYHWSTTGSDSCGHSQEELVKEIKNFMCAQSSEKALKRFFGYVENVTTISKMKASQICGLNLRALESKLLSLHHLQFQFIDEKITNEFGLNKKFRKFNPDKEKRASYIRGYCEFVVEQLFQKKDASLVVEKIDWLNSILP